MASQYCLATWASFAVGPNVSVKCPSTKTRAWWGVMGSCLGKTLYVVGASERAMPKGPC